MRGMTSDRLRTFIDVILDSVDGRTSGEELARRAYLSRFHFDRLVSSALGESPAAFRRRLLLGRAAYALRDGTVTEVAFAAGYGSPEAFARAFKRAFGVAPSAHTGTSGCRRRTASTSIRPAACSCRATTHGGMQCI